MRGRLHKKQGEKKHMCQVDREGSGESGGGGLGETTPGIKKAGKEDHSNVVRAKTTHKGRKVELTGGS